MDRRTFMSLAFGAAATGWRDIARAEEHRALFWRIETPDNATAIVFGYARTAASVLPDIVRDGVRLIEQSGRVFDRHGQYPASLRHHAREDAAAGADAESAGIR